MVWVRFHVAKHAETGEPYTTEWCEVPPEGIPQLGVHAEEMVFIQPILDGLNNVVDSPEMHSIKFGGEDEAFSIEYCLDPEKVVDDG